MIRIGRPSRRRTWAMREDERRRQAHRRDLARWHSVEDAAVWMIAEVDNPQGRAASMLQSQLRLRPDELVYWESEPAFLVDRGTETEPDLTPIARRFFSIAESVNVTMYAFPAQVPEAGCVVVTTQRVVFQGPEHTREWDLGKLAAVGFGPDSRTLLEVSDRRRLSGLVVYPELAAKLRFYVTLAKRLSDGSGEAFRRELSAQAEANLAAKPVPPLLADPRQAPVRPRRIGLLAAGSVLALAAGVGLFGGLLNREPDPGGVAGAITTTRASGPQLDQPMSPLSRPSSTGPQFGQAPSTTRSAPSRTESASPGKATVDLCGAPENPYGLNFCAAGTKVMSPPRDVCGYFGCVPDFWDGTGYLIECEDGLISLTGGLDESCTDHKGEARVVYE